MIDSTAKASVKSLADLSQEIVDKTGELDKLTGQIRLATAKLEALKADIKTGQTRTNARTVHEMNAARLDKIAQRQADVLSLLQEGLSPDDISTRLDVSLKTIKRDILALNGKAQEVMTK